MTELIDRLLKKVLDELCKSGVSENTFTLTCHGERDLLDESEEFVSLGIEVKVNSFETDEGITKEDSTYFITEYDKDEDEIYLIFGEDDRMDITYGNLFAFMYFSNIEVNTQ